MKDLFGNEYEYPVIKKSVNKAKRNWENRFQRWANKEAQNGLTPDGICGYGEVCDYCTDNTYGKPCVRALNAMLKEKRKSVDYTSNDYKKVWYGEL